MSEAGTKPDHFQASQKLISYKGVLDFLLRTYVRTEATFAIAKLAFSKMENLNSPRGRFAVQVSKWNQKVEHINT